MPVEIGCFTLAVPDVDRGAAFYGALFGWTFDASPSTHAYRHIDNTRLPGGLVAHDAQMALRPYYRVDDLRAAVAQVRALGGDAEEPQASPTGWSCLCHDDQRVPFGLWQPAPGL